jgi:hypothetical protein
MRFVNVYYQTQRYGGPEEGGWWYDHNEPVSSKRFTSNRKCKKWWKKQVAFASNMNMCLPDYTSSRSKEDSGKMSPGQIDLLRRSMM